MPRFDGRANNEMRPVHIAPNYLSYAEGSALIEVGDTRILCAATVEDRVPPFLAGKGKGWVTAEYALLPRSTLTRTQRESVAGRLQGRTQEIQRLIGRSFALSSTWAPWASVPLRLTAMSSRPTAGHAVRR